VLAVQEHACVEGCPVRHRHPPFIKKIKEGDFMAHSYNKGTNSLPACADASAAGVAVRIEMRGWQEGGTGRHRPLEGLPRIMSWAGDVKAPEIAHDQEGCGCRAGPGGLTVAASLQRRARGDRVRRSQAGGVLVYGILNSVCPRRLSSGRSTMCRSWAEH